MTHPPIVAPEDASVGEALRLLRNEKIRRLPIVDKHGKMVGIVSEQDLFRVSPSQATSLSAYEIPALLDKIKMRDVMTQEVITVAEDTPLEEAARIMVDSGVSGLPVMRGDKLVGIITETDLFKIFLEFLGARECGVRLSVTIPNEKGTLAGIAGKIAALGGNIMAMGTIMGEDPSTRQMTMRVADVTEDQLIKAMEELGLQVLDVRFCALA